MATKSRGARKRDNKKQKSSSNLKSTSFETKNKTINKVYKDSNLWTKALSFGSIISESGEEWVREDVVLIIYWARQILSLALGILWGIVRFEGILAILTYLIVCIFTLQSYKSTLKVPDDTFDIGDDLRKLFYLEYFYLDGYLLILLLIMIETDNNRHYIIYPCTIFYCELHSLFF